MHGGFMHKVMTKEENFKISQFNRRNLKILIGHMKKYRLKLSITIIITLITSITLIIPPYLSKIIVDDYILKKDIKGLQLMILIYLFIHVINWASNYWQTYLSKWIGQKVISDVRRSLYKKLLSLPFKFYTKSKRGELVSVVVNDVNALSDAITSGLVNFTSDVLSLVGILIFMLYLDIKLTLIVSITLPIIFLAMNILGKKIRKAYQEVRVRIAKLNTNVEENISGIRIVQSLSAQNRNSSEFNQINQGNLQANMKAVLLFAMFFPIMALTSSLGTALVVWFGGKGYIANKISIGVLVAFLGYIRRFFIPLRDLSQIYNTYQSAAASLTRISYYLDIPKQMEEDKNISYAPDAFKGKIDFNNVEFSYEEEPVIKGISFSIKSGEKIGIVGETGAGKTTLINLLTRFYDVDSGSILIDDINVKNISSKDLRKTVSVVSQNAFLFSDTIKNNILFGNPDTTFEQVIDAAKKAQAHDFIEKLPEGYNTVVGQNGILLSGGQRQLVTFARTLLADPRILILDEATSNVDSYTESKIQKALEQLLKDRTAIIIAHRFATLDIVETIYVLDKGEIIAKGTHEELLKSSVYYKELYEKQH